jgi:hypothetical protein
MNQVPHWGCQNITRHTKFRCHDTTVHHCQFMNCTHFSTGCREEHLEVTQYWRTAHIGEICTLCGNETAGFKNGGQFLGLADRLLFSQRLYFTELRIVYISDFFTNVCSWPNPCALKQCSKRDLYWFHHSPEEQWLMSQRVWTSAVNEWVTGHQCDGN